MGSRRHTPSQVRIPVPSAALITEESREDFPHEGSRASVEVSTAAEAFTAAAVVTAAVVIGNWVGLQQNKVRHGEQNHAPHKSETHHVSWTAA
jgi:hypothetical protein